MLKRIIAFLRLWFEKEQCFIVHFIVINNYNFEQLIKNLSARHTLQVQSNDGDNLHTIYITIKPSVLRAVQQDLPETVLVSYEALESRIC